MNHYLTRLLRSIIAMKDPEPSTQPQVELNLELELVNKVLSIDAANIETLDEFMQGGHLMSGDTLDPVVKNGEESFTVRFDEIIFFLFFSLG